MNTTIAPAARPLYVMAKPAGSCCNLACDYCYYLEKNHLYTTPSQQRMMDDYTLETFIRQYIQAQTQPQVLFTWHGGEPLMRPLAFYRRAVALQRQYAEGRLIDNCLQTNATLLTEEWCRFLHDNHWLVGVSIDGPQELHDEYRRSRGRQPSWHKVMRGIQLLERYGVEWNVMGVVNDFNADYPLDVYHFYKEIGGHYIQFTPIVERLLPHPDGRHLASPADNAHCTAHNDATLKASEDGSHSTVAHTATPSLAPFSVRPGQYAHFVNTIFDEWVRQDVGEVFVQLFDSTLACWVGETPSVCSMAPTCGHAAAIEHNGDLYSCDHFVFPEYRLGNIHTSTIAAMMYSHQQLLFGQSKRDSLPPQCHQCPWLHACHGGCPKDRFCTTPDGHPGLNFLCADYRNIFAHVAPAMDFMAEELRHQRPPANIMTAIATIMKQTNAK